MNPTKAQKELGWKPKYEGLKGFEKGLKLTVDWFKNEANNEKSKYYNL